MTTCPVCGAPVTAIHSDEGTNAVVYTPEGAAEALAKEAAPMAAQLREATAREAACGRELADAHEEIERLRRTLADTEAELRYAAGLADDDDEEPT